MTRRLLIGTICAAVLLLAGIYLWGPSKTPPGQPALSILSASNFGEFQDVFDSSADAPRIILLLSPT